MTLQVGFVKGLGFGVQGFGVGGSGVWVVYYNLHRLHNAQYEVLKSPDTVIVKFGCSYRSRWSIVTRGPPSRFRIFENLDIGFGVQGL